MCFPGKVVEFGLLSGRFTADFGRGFAAKRSVTPPRWKPHKVKLLFRWFYGIIAYLWDSGFRKVGVSR